MEKTEEFSINYWGKEFDYTNPPRKTGKIKRNLAVLVLFISIAIVTPTLILNINSSKLLTKKVETDKSATFVKPTQNNKIASAQNPIQGQVIKNDSYWKISKRYCGTGEFYLTIQEKNDFKPLYENDPVTIVCR